MGMHQPGWRERNEDQAWEEWEADAKAQVVRLQAIELRLIRSIENRVGRAIVEAVQDLDTIGERLFAMRDGPERPE